VNLAGSMVFGDGRSAILVLEAVPRSWSSAFCR